VNLNLQTHNHLQVKWSYLSLVFKCIILVSVIRLVLTFKSYKPVIKAISSIEGSKANYRKPLILAWGVKKASRFVPKATCLTQALALRWLMARSDQDCAIRIGVMSDPSGAGMKAHAWVIYNSDIIIGGDSEDISNYTVLVDL